MKTTIFAKRNGKAKTIEIYKGDMSAWFKKVSDNGSIKADLYQIVVLDDSLDIRSAVSSMIGKEWLPSYDKTMERYGSQLEAEQA